MALCLILDLLTVAPGMKAGMDFSKKGLISHLLSTCLDFRLHITVLYRCTFALLMLLEAIPKKSEINLLSLLSSFDDIIDTLPEEKDEVPQKKETPKLPRSNSLEDLVTKVCIL